MTVEDWAAGATIGGEPVPAEPDLARMRRRRHERLQRTLEAQGLDGAILLGSSAVAYATGALAPGDDSGRAGLLRPTAVVVRGAEWPHLFTPFWDGAPPELPSEHLHGPVAPDLDEGAASLAAALAELFAPGARLAIDDQPYALVQAVQNVEWVDATPAMGAAKITKTPDEVTCIRTAQRINELAMLGAQSILQPGVRQSDLSGAFLRHLFDLGASAGSIDPIWQVMAPTKEAGPWTSHGDLAYPTSTTDRLLREGDVIWVDAGILYQGYASDYGRTWITSTRPVPDARQLSQFRRWRNVVDSVLEQLKPGVSALQLGRAATAANDGVRPWIRHFYLAHGVGTDSAEMPLIGTDLGEAFDEQLVMEPGMVLVLEPVIWDEGAAGYRAEDIVAVTDSGWTPLSGSSYTPYEVVQ